MREGLDETARSLSDAASDGRGGMTGAFGGVLRWEIFSAPRQELKQWISLQSRSKHNGEADYSWCCSVEQPLGWNEKSDKVKIQIWFLFENLNLTFLQKSSRAICSPDQRAEEEDKWRMSWCWWNSFLESCSCVFLVSLGGISSWNPAPAYSWFHSNNN